MTTPDHTAARLALAIAALNDLRNTRLRQPLRWDGQLLKDTYALLRVLEAPDPSPATCHDADRL